MKKLHLLVTGFIISAGLAHVQNAQASENALCSSVIPADAKISKALYLCESSAQGERATYACQDLVSSQGQYRLMFQGGRIPAMVMMKSANGKQAGIVWTKQAKGSQPECNLPADDTLPAGLKFIGAGVCQDEHNQNVPCTVFRQKEHRQSMVTDYLSLYDREGAGIESTEIINTGINSDAMPAEFAYQLGLNLMKTECCQYSGLKYIEYAYQLFPASTLYRTSYQYFESQLSTQEQHQDNKTGG